MNDNLNQTELYKMINNSQENNNTDMDEAMKDKLREIEQLEKRCLEK